MHSLFIPFLLQFLFPPFLKFPTGNDPFRPNCPSCSNSPDKIFTQIGNMETQAIFFFSDTSLHTYKTSASFLFMYSLFTSLYGCIAPYIVIDLLDFLSIAFSSLLFQYSIPVIIIVIIILMHALSDVKMLIIMGEEKVQSATS